RNVPLPKHELDKAQINDVSIAKRSWQEWLMRLRSKLCRPKKAKDIRLEAAAAARYTSWYYNRRKYFPASVQPYAERSRDQVLRLAMLHAICCDRFFIGKDDVEFGIMLLGHVAHRIADVMVPTTPEALAANDIKAMLPATIEQILTTLVRKHSRLRIDTALKNLRDAKEITRKESGHYVPTNT
ncbi:MAG: hypothetical protein MN733_25300, partial [Nitrososphaera sp.]|nr:hypothetical protein [Nitrososphaera sp.]